MTAMLPENDEDAFALLRAGDIPRESERQRWLIESLWSESSVGLIGGLPKCLKSWIALDMAVSVATLTACLGRFEVPRGGPALAYLAEDSLAALRERLEALAALRGLDIADLDLHVIAARSMRLDLERDQVRLLKTARALAPRLLLLDPLVRIHRLDENSSAEVSRFLA